MLDPNFTSDLEQMLRDKGHTPGQIENAMARPREQVKNAQTEDLTSKYLTAMQSGNMQNADILLTKLAQYNPEAAQILAMRSPSNKDAYNVNVKREDAKTANDYATGRMEKGHELSEETANNNVGRQQAITSFTSQLKLQTQGMGREQEYNFLYNKLIKAGASPHEAAQAALGIKQNAGNSNQLSAQYKAAVDYIKQAEEWEKNNMGGKWEDQEGLKAARQIQRAWFMPQGGSSGAGSNSGAGGYNTDGDAMRLATQVLEQNRSMNMKYPKEAIVARFRQEFGDKADAVIEKIDWEKWGYYGATSRPDYQPGTD